MHLFILSSCQEKKRLKGLAPWKVQTTKNIWGLKSVRKLSKERESIDSSNICNYSVNRGIVSDLWNLNWHNNKEQST